MSHNCFQLFHVYLGQTSYLHYNGKHVNAEKCGLLKSDATLRNMTGAFSIWNKISCKKFHLTQIYLLTPAICLSLTSSWSLGIFFYWLTCTFLLILRSTPCCWLVTDKFVMRYCRISKLSTRPTGLSEYQILHLRLKLFWTSVQNTLWFPKCATNGNFVY